MTDLGSLPLQDLLIGAAEAPPDRRVAFRDPIAKHGAAAIDALEAWLLDPQLAGFAVRAIGHAADFGARRRAITVLQNAANGTSETLRRDAAEQLQRLGSASGVARPPRRASPKLPTSLPGHPDELSLGSVYQRRAVHDRLGGNRRRGISYPAAGDYVMLFSDPAKRHEWGYKDTWSGADTYRYFGEWNGTGDMTLTGGNQVILDRSPRLHLFIASPGGHRYEGRFSCSEHEPELTEREGSPFTAIVFVLRRIKPR